VKLRPYPAYKDSGLSWLGKIPTHWEVRRGKSVFTCIDVRSKTGDEELLTVSANDGVVPRREKTVTMFMAESYVGHKLCWPGDLVINSLWAWMKGLGFSRHHGIVSSAYGVYRPCATFSGCWPYFDYLLRSNAYDWELRVRSKGIWTSRLQLTDDAFLEMPIAAPPNNEAKQIAAFLNAQDRRIRRFIRAKRRLIEMLNEQRQAIIHRGVTRGLDPTGCLKPFGIDWLGNVPVHWDITRVRRLITFITSGSRDWAEFYSDNGDLFIQSGNLNKSMSLDLGRVQRVDIPTRVEGLRTRIAKNDILVCITGALTGNVAFVDVDLPSAYVNQHVALLRPNPSFIMPRFLAYVLHSNFGQSQFKLTEYGGTKQGLGLNDVRDILVLLPGHDEQHEIVTALDMQTAHIIAAIERAKKQIDAIREYRTRLIADVVTGKLDVRGVELAETDETAVLDDLDEGEEIVELAEQTSEVEANEEEDGD
jgi:type I restriction enzyme S subunit